MDTHGHQECAENAGNPILSHRLALANKEGWNVTPFYLGNWITDVQQIVDPIAAEGFREQIAEAIDSLVASIRGIESSGWQTYLRDVAAETLESRKDQLNRGYNWAFTSSGGGPRNAPLFKTIKSSFYVTGYFKFVHPDPSTSIQEMDYNAYKHIFNSGYRQYYPHEHLDRFPKLADSGPAYTRNAGTVTANGRGTGSSSLSPHMYQYLREDVELIAGLLAELDRDWAANTFQRAGQQNWQSDTDQDWCFKLATLGHALHGCEDFFAHSNFIELAIEGLPDAQRRRFKPSRRVNRDGTTGALEIYQRRLTRYNGNPDSNGGSAGTPETWLVTGYFDGIDTLFSMRHAFEEIFGGHEGHGPPAQSSRARDVGELMLKIIRDLQTRGPFTTRAAARSAAQDSLTRHLNNDPDVRAAANDLVNHVPAEVRNHFLDSIAGFCQQIPGTALTIFDLFIFVDKISDAITRPMELLEWLVVGLPSTALDWIVEQVREPFTQAVGRAVDHFIGRNRVGCHSLLGKDYSGEDSELNRLYDQAKSCAKAVHWYVIKTMTRWATPVPISASRSTSGGTQTATRDSHSWIDWLELLESLLRHPHQVVRSDNEAWWQPILSSGWTRFPGYNNLTPRRDADLHHALIPITAAARDQQIERSQSLRRNGESAYDSSG